MSLLKPLFYSAMKAPINISPISHCAVRFVLKYVSIRLLNCTTCQNFLPSSLHVFKASQSDQDCSGVCNKSAGKATSSVTKQHNSRGLAEIKTITCSKPHGENCRLYGRPEMVDILNWRTGIPRQLFHFKECILKQYCHLYLY